MLAVSICRALRRCVTVPRSRVLSAGCARSLARRGCGTEAGSRRGCSGQPEEEEEEWAFVDTWTDVEQERLRGPAAAPPPAPRAAGPPSPGRRSLERQLQVSRGSSQPEDPEPHSLVPFHQEAAGVATKRRKKTQRQQHWGGAGPALFGSPDPDQAFSDTCCPGCGAVLHCTALALPGYLPSEKFKALLREGRLGGATCQRCHLLSHHHRALKVQVSPAEYRAVVQNLRPLRALVLLVVDLLDIPDSIVPDLPQLVGANKRLVVLGNKVDLLPPDSPNHLQRLRRRLAGYCEEAGFGSQVTDVHLVSAKTGYGVEALVSSLQRSWKYKGDVYLVGVANAGKSTLFNALLQSDYCKSRASELTRRATISPWPGTTLNLLKFPIINPTPHRLHRRQQRLDAASKQTEAELPQEELRRLQHLSRKGYLVGRVGRTFLSSSRTRRGEVDFDPDRLSFGEVEETETTVPSAPLDEMSSNELKDAHWLFDTPGIMKEQDILSLLTEQEVVSVVPTQAIVPRTFALKPSTSVFVGGLARIDFLQGAESCWFSVMASSRVPVHVTGLQRADAVYQTHAGGVLLGVPAGGPERMRTFPAFVAQDVRLEGAGDLEAAADITLSSAGWVAVTAAAGAQLLLRLHGPPAAGFRVRTPALLPRLVSLRRAAPGGGQSLRKRS